VLLGVEPTFRLVGVLVILFVLALPVLLVLILLRDEDKTAMDYVRDVLANPRRVLQDSLADGEKVLSWSRPAITAYLWNERRVALQTFVTLLAFVYFTFLHQSPLPLGKIAFLVFDGHILYLAYRRLEDWYTLYVFTDRRVMRLSGVFNRDSASIDWPRIQDFAWQQAFLGRLLGYATLRVDSASEKASLKELKDIPGRFRINNLMVENLKRHER
jgi:Bacterial PH domain